MAKSKATLCGLALGVLIFASQGIAESQEIGARSKSCDYSKGAQGSVEFTRTENFDAPRWRRVSLPRWAEVALMIPGVLVYLGIGFYACMGIVVLVIRDDGIFNNQRNR